MDEKLDIYSKDLSQGIVTLDMLGACAYRENKAAKQYRDDIREKLLTLWYADRNPEYKEYIEKDINSNREAMLSCYERKNFYLSFISPEMIQRYRSVGYVRAADGKICEERYLYYLLYRAGGYTFHQPIFNELDICKYELCRWKTCLSASGHLFRTSTVWQRQNCAIKLEMVF